MAWDQATLDFIKGLILFAVVLPLCLLALAARVNHLVTRDLPPSPRLASALFWNLRTGGLSAWGGVARLALAAPKRLDDLSLFLRAWCRRFLGWTLGLGLLACLVPTEYRTASLVASTLLTLGPMLYFVVGAVIQATGVNLMS